MILQHVEMFNKTYDNMLFRCVKLKIGSKKTESLITAVRFFAEHKEGTIEGISCLSEKRLYNSFAAYQNIRRQWGDKPVKA